MLQKAAAKIRDFDLSYSHYNEDEQDVLEVEDDFHEDSAWSRPSRHTTRHTARHTPPTKPKQWVDLDNVQDDDPFNLFGTSKPEAASKMLSDSDDEDSRQYHSFSRGQKSRYQSTDRRLSRREGGGSVNVGAGDLRAKLMGRRRNNRNF